MNKPVKGGYTDRPAAEDDFKIERYIIGLTDFIKTCNTPITIAIQGDWGTGKTSIMSMVHDRLKGDPSINLVWFNTWQFSQFNMGEKLPLVMLGKLVSAVADKQTDKIKQTAEKLFEGIGRLAIGYVSGGASNGSDIKELFTEDFIAQMDSLKATFQTLVDSKAGADGRVVVFIDDLDRLQPGKAVELLEVLKVFLDCEKCVFILAIDYNVVARGVREKYGEDFSEEKGKNFFDKIIQVPFKMPVADYDISNYVRKGLETIGVPVNDENLGVYVSLINDSIGNNPRSMKRLFNSYLLLSKIANNELLADGHRRTLLFALLCMQSQYEGVYNSLIRNRKTVNAEQIVVLGESNHPLFSELGMGKEEINAFINFANDFNEVIDADQTGSIDEAELMIFRQVLGFSAITANSAQNENAAEGEYRWRHKDRCRRYLKVLSERYPKIAFKEYYTRTHNKGTWWGYTPNGARTPNGLAFSFEFRFDPAVNGETMKSVLTINLYRWGKEYTIEDILSELGTNPLAVLGVAPVIDSPHAIRYKAVTEFDTVSEENDAELLEIICKAIDAVKKYFV